jgi:hypothetical protein
MSPMVGELVTETFEYDGRRRSRRMSRRGNRLRRWRPVDHVMGWRPSKRPIYRRLSSSVHTGWTMRRCGSMSTHRAAAPPPSLLTLNDSQHTRSSLSRTYAAGRSRASALCYLSNEPRYSVSRRAESLRSPWGFAIYGTVFCASPGAGYRPPAMMPGSLPRAYLVAGMQEPFFLKNATRWADALRGAGADVVMTERSGSHGDAFWREELPLMVAWAFGR